jgi:class 3 adenylate cyclase
MFCDLVASATLSTRLDIEDFRDVILTNNVCVADLVREHNGKMACYMGDGTLAYFGHPEAGEDNADQAIHAALAIIENVARLKNDLGVELKVRIGIATGVVVVGDVMSDGVVRDRPLLGRRRISRHACSRLLSLTRC